MADKAVVFRSHRKGKDDSEGSLCQSGSASAVRSRAGAKFEEHDKSHICEWYLLTKRGQSLRPYLISPKS